MVQTLDETAGAPELGSDAISILRGTLQGSIITPDDEAYDEARQVWNAAIDKHPALIVYPADTAGVVQAVNFARQHNLTVAIRGGKHGLPGFGVAENGLVIDMSNFKRIEVDPVARKARIQGGILGKELGAVASPHGLALPLGQVPTTGVAGVLTGGGIGWLTRQYGLSIDSLLSAEVVTAGGKVLFASETENPDLFWAIRGGGGNFGVVTEMEVELHPAGMIVGGLVLHPIEQAGEVLRFYRDFIASAPEALSTTVIFMNVPPIPMIPEALHGRKAIAVGVCYIGDLGEGQQVVAPLRAFGQPLMDMVSPMPFGVLQSLGEAGGHLGLQHDIRSGYLQELSDGAIDTIARHTQNLPVPLGQVNIIHLGGAMSRVATDATAFPHRDARFIYNIVPSWMTPAETESTRAWMLDFAADLRPFSSGVYVNFLGDEGADRVREAYGSNYDRLAALKRKYDPTNFFRLNQNIPPAEA